LLETANIKLASVATEAFGVSGMAMLEALVENKAAPAEMAELARGTLRRKREPLTHALDGRMTEHHRYMLAFHLRRLAAIEEDLRALDARIEERVQPFQAQRQLLQQIPGVDALVAATIIAEIGIDMSVFGNAMRLAAWAGVCPGNHESAGKRKSGVARRGNVHLKTALVTAAVCASRQKGSYYKDKYHRLRARRGRLRARWRSRTRSWSQPTICSPAGCRIGNSGRPSWISRRASAPSVTCSIVSTSSATMSCCSQERLEAARAYFRGS
jgi:transposase